MTTRLVALDIAGTTFTETYRIGVFHGIIDFARREARWKLLYNVKTFSLVHRYADYGELPALGAHGIIFSTRDPARLAAIRATGLPAVSISSNPAEGFPAVTTDDHAVGRLAAQHFLERGFVNFAFVGSATVEWEVRRHQGFREAASARSPHCHFFADEKGSDPEANGRTARALERWIADLPKPVAIMGADDGRALHVLEACNDLGIPVPFEVAIVGVDNTIVVCESLLPSLSSVEQNHSRVGWEAAALLERLMGGEPAGPDLAVPPRAVVTRMSSDVIAVDDPALGRAVTHIRDHLSDALSVDDVARAAGISRSLLEKRFRHHLGTTVTGVVRDQRLKAAMRLMVESTLLIKEIAEVTGFHRASYFSNVFREEFGESPRDWRRRNNPGAVVE
jgi:LacI family transcriptional regulator